MAELAFSITKEDFKNSSGKFHDVHTCPLAIALKRVLGRDDIFVGTFAVYRLLDPNNLTVGSENRIGHIYPWFEQGNFENLKNNGTEFKATFVY